jgi:glycosyltransferase involved in cell wall biosynthesis
VWSLWDLSRQLWFGQPQTVRPDLAKFLGEGRNFRKWAYTPVDSTGPDEHGLPMGMAAAAMGYDRLLAASEWGANVLRRTRPDADWIPHGIWMDKFQVKPQAKILLDWDGFVTVGCNMGNQARKDWPVAFECASLLKQEYGNRFKFWAHTDATIRYWNLAGLAADYGVGDCTELTMDLNDEQLAQRYSACDCTILPSGGEGFGYTIAESMACGTACVVTYYAAGQELVDEDCKVPPVAYRVDTMHNTRRAVLSGYGFANRAGAQIERKQIDWEGRGQEVRERVGHLDWEKLKPVWTRWLLEGIGR